MIKNRIFNIDTILYSLYSNFTNCLNNVFYSQFSPTLNPGSNTGSHIALTVMSL